MKAKQHGDRRRDQHFLAEIERNDGRRGDEGDGGGAQEARVASFGMGEIEDLHGCPLSGRRRCCSGGVNDIVDEAQLIDCRLGEHEGIEVGLAHRAVEAVERQRQRQPAVDQRADAGRAIGIEIDAGVELVAARQPGVRRQAEGAGDLQRVDDMEVMRPGLGEVLPGMRRGVGADEMTTASRPGAPLL